MLLPLPHGGAGGNVVKINTRTIERVRINATCYSGVRFGSDGVLYLRQNNNGLSAVATGEWLVSGSAATYYVHRTVNDGTLTTDAGTALQLNANRDYDIARAIPGTVTAQVSFIISTSATPGTGELDEAVFTFSAEYDTEA